VTSLKKNSLLHPQQSKGKKKKKITSNIRRIALTVLAVFIAYIVLMKISLFLFPLPLNKLETEYSAVYLSKEGELLRIDLNKAGNYRIKLKYEQMPETLIKGVPVCEDKWFYLHPGFNVFSLFRAGFDNWKKGRIVSGGSTITMQVAKMMEHSGKKRTLKIKLKELFRSLQLESRYSKKEILEMYINTISMGGNIQGIGAASFLYYGKPAASLSAGQCSLLIGILKTPERTRPDKANNDARQVRDRILKKIRKGLKLKKEEISEAKSERIPSVRIQNPFIAASVVKRTSGTGDPYIKHLSVDLVIQKHCEKILNQLVGGLKKNGVNNGALIAVNNRTMQVLAYSGSVDESDPENGGQYNAANISRSPGSALKPFVYARAIENGLITPKKVIFDIPRNYDGYVPVNFAKSFQGVVTAEEALYNSLNLPPVDLEYRMKKNGLAAFLNEAGISGADISKNSPGLSIVLGAFPVTLEQIVKMYCCLANGGEFRELSFFLERENSAGGKRIISKEASYIVSEMLSESTRPYLPNSWEFTQKKNKVAFKTGTSFGPRDAWCIGYTPEFTVGVWLGNLDSKPSFALEGSKTAAPAVVEVIDYLSGSSDSWFSIPQDVRTREVCVVSGDKPGPFCDHTRNDLYIPGVSSNVECTVHKRIYVDKKTGEEVCRSCCKDLSKCSSRIVEVWPPDLTDHFLKKGRRLDLIPQHSKSCNSPGRYGKLSIKNPGKNAIYMLRNNSEIKEGIALKANTNVESEEVYWFLDDVLVSHVASNEQVFIKPQPGKHAIKAMTISGLSDSVSIYVGQESDPVR